MSACVGGRRGGGCAVRSKLNKFEHVWEGGQGQGSVQMGRARALYRGGQCPVQRGSGHVQRKDQVPENITFTTPLAGGNKWVLNKRKITPKMNLQHGR